MVSAGTDAGKRIRVAKFSKKGKPSDTPFSSWSTLDTTAAEKEFNPEADWNELGIWIGLYVARDNSSDQARALESDKTEGKKPVGKGASVNTLGSFEHTEVTENVLRVVLRASNTQQAAYYALTSRDEDSHLCNALQITIADVYWFSKFRDDTASSNKAREDVWPRLARQYRTKLAGGPEPLPYTVSKHDGKKYDKPTFTIDKTSSLANGIYSHVMNAVETGNTEEVVKRGVCSRK